MTKVKNENNWAFYLNYAKINDIKFFRAFQHLNCYPVNQYKEVLIPHKDQ